MTKHPINQTDFYYAGKRLTMRDRNGNVFDTKDGARKIHNKAARRLIRRNSLIGRRAGRYVIEGDEIVYVDRLGRARLPPFAVQLAGIHQAQAEVNALSSNSHEFKRLWKLSKIERRQERQKDRDEALKRK